MKIAAMTGSPVDVAEAEIDELRMMMRGPLLCAGQPGYDEARVVYNGMFDRRPALIARCRGGADVMDAVRFASRRHLLTAIRGAGHSVAGASICEGGLVIDLSQMSGVVVDHKRRVAERTLNGADDHINKLAKKYLNEDVYPFRQPGEQRVLYKVKPERFSALG